MVIRPVFNGFAMNGEMRAWKRSMRAAQATRS
jgi:hypothetical protein